MKEEYPLHTGSSHSSGNSRTSGSNHNHNHNHNQSHIMEQSALNSYHPPGTSSLVFEGKSNNDKNCWSPHHTHNVDLTDLPSKCLQWVYNPSDGSVLRDPSTGNPVSVDRLLATKPLRGELSTRPGPGNKKLTYLSGDGVTRTLNDIFGYDGWNLDICKAHREECLKDPTTGKYSVVYTAMVRVTHRASGAYREECGTGDSVDRHFGTAVGHALKGSITDAMKRAARHFGEKLGNSLYDSAFSINKAPTTLKEALDRYDIDRANVKFGFAKDHKQPSPAGVGRDAASPNKVTGQRQQPPTTTESVPSGPVVHPVAWQRNSSRNSAPSTASRVGSVLPSAPQGPPTDCPQILPEIPVPTTSADHMVSRSYQPCPPTTMTSSAPTCPLAVNTARPSQNRPKVPTPIQSTNQACSIHSSSTQPPCQVPSTSSVSMPPPTPTDSLRNSGIFSFHTDRDHDHSTASTSDSIPPRPVTSYGKPSRTSLTTSQPPPLVTPTAQQQHHQQLQQQSISQKRPALQSVGNLDPSQTKKVLLGVPPVGPVSNATTTNPYGKISRM